MKNTNFEDLLRKQSQHPDLSGNNGPLSLIIPATNQIPTPKREFLLQTPSEGLSYIATVAKNAGWDVKIFDLRLQDSLSLKDTCQEVIKRGGILAMPTFLDSLPQNEEVFSIIKSASREIVTICGGTLVSSRPEPILRLLNVDYAVLREGELTLLELLGHIKSKGTKEGATNIAGLGIRFSKEKILFTPPREQIQNLDNLPLPDLFLYPATQKNPTIPELGITTSRGCYGRCAFCFVNIPKLRFKSPERFADELSFLLEKHGCEYLFINDLTFTANKSRTWQICEVLKNHNLSWSCSTRVESVDKDLLRTMKASGCREIWYGVESLEQNILDLCHKNQSVEEIERAIDLTVESGITVMANFIIGLPGETEDSLQKLLSFVESKKVIPSSIKYLTPFPGTEFYDMALREGKITDEIAYIKKLSDRRVNDTNDDLLNLTDLPEEVLRKTFYLATKMRENKINKTC